MLVLQNLPTRFCRCPKWLKTSDHAPRRMYPCNPFRRSWGLLLSFEIFMNCKARSMIQNLSRTSLFRCNRTTISYITFNPSLPRFQNHMRNDVSELKPELLFNMFSFGQPPLSEVYLLVAGCCIRRHLLRQGTRGAYVCVYQ